jgi:hypothetical protein
MDIGTICLIILGLLLLIGVLSIIFNWNVVEIIFDFVEAIIDMFD